MENEYSSSGASVRKTDSPMDRDPLNGSGREAADRKETQSLAVDLVKLMCLGLFTR